MKVWFLAVAMAMFGVACVAGAPSSEDEQPSAESSEALGTACTQYACEESCIECGGGSCREKAGVGYTCVCNYKCY